MEVKDLNDKQLKQIYCAAVGWHSQLDKEDATIEQFDDFFDQITYERDNNSWVIRGYLAQIELYDRLYFRCGMKKPSPGIGGTAFDFKAVYNCFKSFGLMD